MNDGAEQAKDRFTLLRVHCLYRPCQITEMSEKSKIRVVNEMIENVAFNPVVVRVVLAKCNMQTLCFITKSHVLTCHCTVQLGGRAGGLPRQCVRNDPPDGNNNSDQDTSPD